MTSGSDGALDAMLREYDALREEIRLHKTSMRQHYLILLSALSIFVALVQLGDATFDVVNLVMIPLVIMGFALLSINDNLQVLILAKHLQRLEGRINERVQVRAMTWESGTAAALWRLSPRRGPLAERLPPNFTAYWVGFPLLGIGYLAIGALAVSRLWPVSRWLGILYGMALGGALLFLAFRGRRDLALLKEGGGLDGILDALPIDRRRDRQDDAEASDAPR